MKDIFRKLLILFFAMSLNCGYTVAVAMPEPAQKEMTPAQKKRMKEAAKRKKEAEKKKKELARKNKAKAKAAADREEARAKAEEQVREKAEQEKADWAKYQDDLANPKAEAISYFNLGLRAGYAAMMDNIEPIADNILWGAGTLNQNNHFQQLKGGPGAGLGLNYGLEYKHFLFETGLDFRYLNSTSAYGFQLNRLNQTYNDTYTYLFDNMRETRNMMQVGLPVMFGAQFNRYYFLLGAKVGYTLFGNYKQKGLYDIVVNDPSMLEPYGLGIFDIPQNQTEQAKITFKQPEVSLCAEFGIDLDEWLQAQPDKKKKKTVKPGERLPFGRENIHYRLSAFAEYGLLNTNATEAALPVVFANNSPEVQQTNTMLAMNGNTKLNNLFAGIKFTVQFEVPGKRPRAVPAPASYANYTVVDAATGMSLPFATIETTADKTGKIALKEKQMGKRGAIKQRHALGEYSVVAKAQDYYDATASFEITEPGEVVPVDIRMTHRPVFRVRVTNKETGAVIPATINIRHHNSDKDAYTLTTDSVTGSSKSMLEEGPQYVLHIEQVGYEALDMAIASVGDSLNVELTPIKKGEVFVVRNLHFATNKTKILPTSEEALNSLYMYLARNPEIRIKIIGHTDNVGKDDANQKLSDGRANAVMQDLIERGIAADRLQAEGRGETQPIADNDTEEGRQLNRRVEVEILE